MKQYIIAKTSRCYYGGEGCRRGELLPLIFDSIADAVRYAVDDGNPIGFDIYEYISERDETKPQLPTMRWPSVKELGRNINKV